MSRATIIIALARVLHRQPTKEEYAEFRVAVLASCPTGRIYIPTERPSLFNDIADLSRNGWSVRKIARKLGVSKSQVHRELSQIPVAKVDSDPPNV
jgi:hypothetical protein